MKVTEEQIDTIVQYVDHQRVPEEVWNADIPDSLLEGVAVHRALALEGLTTMIHESCRRAGWYTDLKTGEPITRNVGEMIALIHTEISEAMEGYRRGSADEHLMHRMAIEVELADAIHRICDLAGYLGLDIGGALAEKFLYNRMRSDHTREARSAEGGKKI